MNTRRLDGSMTMSHTHPFRLIAGPGSHWTDAAATGHCRTLSLAPRRTGMRPGLLSATLGAA